MGAIKSERLINKLPDDRFQGEIINKFRPISEIKTSINKTNKSYNIYLVSPLYNELFTPKDNDADFKIFINKAGKFKVSYSRSYGYMSAEVTLDEEFETREQALDTLIDFINKHLIKTK
jgi:hypothetical protein